MITRSTLLICLFLSLFYACRSYKILVVFGFPGKSHAILGNELVKLLINDGHEVTYIAAGKYSGPQENISLIDLSDIDTLRTDTFLTIENIMNNFKNLNLKLRGKMKSTHRIFNFWNATIQHRKVQELLLDSRLQFDAVIVDWLYSEMAAGFAAVHQCPLIWFSTMEPDWSVLRLMDGIPNPAYSIDFSTDYVPPFTFLQRAKQLWALIYTFSYHMFVMSPQEEESYNKAFLPAANTRGINLPSLQEMKFKGSLMLGISNAIFSGDISLPQSYKHLGGYHINEPSQPLPVNLQKILNESENGFIYFSMGSRVNTKQMPEQIKKDLINMFGCLNYTVLWKLEEVVPNLPPNVITVQWAPQQSVLAHPNIKLFITHGGLLSMTEAVHFAVPLIGIPGFADQQLNVQRASEKGFCIRVDLSYDLAANLKLAIDEILDKETYKEAVDQLSRIYHNRMMPPRKEMSFWVRHVIESNNTNYLRSTALMVPWYQKIFLDLALVMIFGIIFVSVILRIFFKKAFLFVVIFMSFMSRFIWKNSHGKIENKLKYQ